MSEIERDPSHICGIQPDETQGNVVEEWIAPRMIALEKISNAQKISWNTEHGVISGLS
jgi:hypothetical protein